jgi:hypothetical protein
MMLVVGGAQATTIHHPLPGARTVTTFDRREVLKSSAAWAAAWGGSLWLPRAVAADTPPAEQPVLPVAAIVTEYRINSHADVIVGKILDGYNQDGGAGPRMRLVSLYTDQVPQNDMSRELAGKHGFRICETIEEALTLGSNEIAVAGVLSIGEHGNYPHTPDTKQHMYPRRRFFDAIVAAFRKYKQVVPVFNDKHLAYNWADARHMYDTARELNIPLLAGSSVPLAWRVPPVTLKTGTPVQQAMGLGYGGLESYGFHALEAQQCLLERRRGGETGIAAVQALQGEAIEEARRAGRWSRELLDAAVATTPPPARGQRPEQLARTAVIYALEYRDGLQAAVAMNTGLANEFAAALRIAGDEKPLATWFELQDGKPYLHFAFLVQAIEHTIRHRQPAYPPERTLLTTGALDALMHSLAGNGKRIDTPHLDIAYQPTDWPFATGRAPAPRERP